MQGNLKRIFTFIFSVLVFSQFTANAILPPKINTKSSGNSNKAASGKANFSKKDCQAFIKQMEIENKIPEGLLMSIAAVESEHNPWAINCAGVSRSFTSHEAAKKFVVDLRNQGKVDINIGILQINYGAHKTRFKTAEEVLNPTKNITYAAKYLAQLKKQYGSWQMAVCFYHSPDAKCQEIYLNKVMNILRKYNAQTYSKISGVASVSLKHSRADR
jgi:soluble lytic murein transglycosylase-like protein